MGICLCLPNRNVPPPEEDKAAVKINRNNFIITTPTTKNQSPKNEAGKANFPAEGGKKDTPKTPQNGHQNNNNNEDEDDDIRDVSQIFIKQDNENLDNEDIKNQLRIKLEDFKLLKVCCVFVWLLKKSIGYWKGLVWKGHACGEKGHKYWCLFRKFWGLRVVFIRKIICDENAH